MRNLFFTIVTKDNPRRRLELTQVEELAKVINPVVLTQSPDSWSLYIEQFWFVVDAFISYKKSKAGKRFDFVRFIKVDNIDRLVANLCTIWIGRFHLHANVARFHRELKTSAPSHPSNAKERNSPDRDFSLSLMGKVKGITAMPNLYVILEKEGFQNLSLTYLVGLWVLIETVSIAKEKLLNHTGLVYWVRAKEMEAWDPFICNDSYEGESFDDKEDAEDDESQSGDKVTTDNDVERRKDSADDLKYPPGFTSSVINVEEVNKKVKGATSNEIFYSLFNLDGFDKMVKDTWKSLATVDSNGGSNEEILSDRYLLLKELNDINSIDSLEAAKKSKLSIRGTFADASGLLIRWL
ncbi:hypothetical protein Tco_1078554 [Tanacetum coccineum]|uniref:Uncharacterized protein n=1 Tax=Tanacetum coccineum TaxID=301880 RepID=A0ABQ5HPG3_9ASTR